MVQVVRESDPFDTNLQDSLAYWGAVDMIREYPGELCKWFQ